MAKSRTTFQKRQKEIARMEKQRDKAARRMQRKAAAKQGGGGPPIEELTAPELATPAEPPSNVVE